MVLLVLGSKVCLNTSIDELGLETYKNRYHEGEVLRFKVVVVS